MAVSLASDFGMALGLVPADDGRGRYRQCNFLVPRLGQQPAWESLLNDLHFLKDGVTYKPSPTLFPNELNMKIQVEVTGDELSKMECDTPQDLEHQLRDQIENGVAAFDGSAGVDWLVAYELEVVVVDPNG